MERLSANWKWILTTALPIVFAILVFLPGHPRVRAASGNSVDDVVPVSYEVPDQAKPSPFPAAPSVKRHRQVQPAAVETTPVAPVPVVPPTEALPAPPASDQQ